MRVLNKSECVLVHGINNESVLYLVAGIFLMMKFRWTARKAIEYMCIKQPCFYIVPQFQNVLQLLEDLLKLKYNNEISDEWNLANVKTKDEMIVTNTFINTRIYPIEETAGQGDTNSNTFRQKLENNIPPNNRNIGQKSSTYNNPVNDGPQKQSTRLKWRDQDVSKKPLIEIIVNKALDKAKKASDIDRIICHHEEVKLRSILTKKEAQQVMPNMIQVPVPQQPRVMNTNSKGREFLFIYRTIRGIVVQYAENF